MEETKLMKNEKTRLKKVKIKKKYNILRKIN